MKIFTSVAFAVGIGLICAIVADVGLYAFGVGTMHAIGTYAGRSWMGNMTFPAWSFLAGVTGSILMSIMMIKQKQINFRHFAAILIIYSIGFLALAKCWFMNPRTHDSHSQKPPGWIIEKKNTGSPNTH